LEIKKFKVDEINPAPYNPRIDLQPGDPDYEKLKKSILEFDYVEPIIINMREDSNVLVGGHQRLKILRELGWEEVEASVVNLDSEREKALNLAMNKVQGRWDEELLAEVLQGIDQWLTDEEPDFDLEATGFDRGELDAILDEMAVAGDSDWDPDQPRASLSDRFVVPPFTVLDARQGYWRARKEAWYEQGIATEAGRENLDDTVASGWVSRGNEKGGSAFDPVLAEIAYKWFCPVGGAVLDPFAGESTKGIVAALLGFDYTGIEVRGEQVQANDQQWQAISAGPGVGEPRWITGDAAELDSLLAGGKQYDFIFTSPPYYDLEIYSENEKDGSAFKDYESFMAWYKDIFAQAIKRLSDNAFIMVKVGEIRDKKTGAYRNFVGDNIRCFMDLGLHYYNEAVLVTPVGSLPVRAGRQFVSGRKLGKAHQNILVFYKGDLKKIKDLQFTEVELDEDGSVTLESEAEAAEPDTAEADRPELTLAKAADNALPGEAADLYNATGSVPFRKKFKACPELGSYLKLVYEAGDQELELVPGEPDPVPLQDNGTCWVSFTGGKDSVAAAIKAQEQGYKVIPYYLDGINRGVRDELYYAQQICDRMGWPLVVDKVKISGKKSGVIELPTKNQVIVLAMLGRMAEQGGAVWTAGYHADTKQEERGWGFDFSDGDQAVNRFNEYLARRTPGVIPLQLLQDTLEAWALVADYGLINYIKGCACQPRFKKMRHDHNVKKFGKLLHGRCGSCIKCAWEQVALERLEIIPENPALRKHGRKFLKQFEDIWQVGSVGAWGMEDYLVPPKRARELQRSKWPEQPMPDPSEGGCL